MDERSLFMSKRANEDCSYNSLLCKPSENLPNALKIPNNNNTRYLGGYITQNGKAVKNEKFIRSGLVTGFTDDDG